MVCHIIAIIGLNKTMQTKNEEKKQQTKHKAKAPSSDNPKYLSNRGANLPSPLPQLNDLIMPCHRIFYI